MKKNKTIAYMMAATLLVGGTFLGTKALFTDKVDTVGELRISTGDLDIEITEDTKDAKWVLTRCGEDTNTGSNIATWEGTQGELDFDNLKTGDTLTKTVKIFNNGTLNSNIDLTTTEKTTEGKLLFADGLLEGTATLVQQNDTDKIFRPSEEATITMTLTVVGGGRHNDKENTTYNSDAQETTGINLSEAWTVEAEQLKGNPQKEEVQN